MTWSTPSLVHQVAPGNDKRFQSMCLRRLNDFRPHSFHPTPSCVLPNKNLIPSSALLRENVRNEIGCLLCHSTEIALAIVLFFLLLSRVRFTCSMTCDDESQIHSPQDERSSADWSRGNTHFPRVRGTCDRRSAVSV